MSSSAARSLALFFTRNVSLTDWVESGLYEREKSLYEAYLQRGVFTRIYWITYGRNDDILAAELRKRHELSAAIEALSMPALFQSRPGVFLYSLVAPLLYSKQLRESAFIKTNQMDGSWTALIAKFLYRKPLLLRTGYTASLFLSRQGRSRWLVTVFRLLERIMYTFCDEATVASRQDKEYVCREYGVPEQKVAIVPNYIDTSRFFPNNEHRIDDRVVFVGRLNHQKNLFNAVTAVQEAGLSLDLYGEGALKGALQQHVEATGASVEFKGVIPNSRLPEVLNNYRYFLLPSLYEGMPKSLLEAMACGCVCIGTDTEGINEVIEDGFNGYLAAGTDKRDLCNALLRATKGDSALIAVNAVRTINERYSFSCIMEKERAIIDYLLKAKCHDG